MAEVERRQRLGSKPEGAYPAFLFIFSLASLLLQTQAQPCGQSPPLEELGRERGGGRPRLAWRPPPKPFLTPPWLLLVPTSSSRYRPKLVSQRKAPAWCLDGSFLVMFLPGPYWGPFLP